MRRIIFSISVLILILTLSGCAKEPEVDTFTIATTFLPIYEFTNIIAPDADVYTIVPTDAEPHDFDMSPQDLIALNKADAFITLGLNFAEFEKNLADSAAPQVTLISSTKNINLISKSNTIDPHVWLSPKNAITMVENIRNTLMEKDPQNALEYEENANRYITQLLQLDTDYEEQLRTCDIRVVLAAHDAYSYLAKEYNFTAYYVDGLSPENEPTPKQIARLIDTAQANEIKYILYEENVDPRVSDIIASQVNALPLVIDPFELREDENTSYLDAMQENLNNLKKAMDCK